MNGQTPLSPVLIEDFVEYILQGMDHEDITEVARTSLLRSYGEDMECEDVISLMKESGFGSWDEDEDEDGG
jgi:hypothetical protein